MLTGQEDSPISEHCSPPCSPPLARMPGQGHSWCSPAPAPQCTALSAAPSRSVCRFKADGAGGCVWLHPWAAAAAKCRGARPHTEDTVLWTGCKQHPELAKAPSPRGIPQTQARQQGSQQARMVLGDSHTGDGATAVPTAQHHPQRHIGAV